MGPNETVRTFELVGPNKMVESFESVEPNETVGVFTVSQLTQMRHLGHLH